MKDGDLLINKIELEYKLQELQKAVDRANKMFVLLLWAVKQGEKED